MRRRILGVSRAKPRNNARFGQRLHPGIHKRLADLGFVLIGNTPEEFGAYFRSEIEAWGKIVRELKLSAD
jgi:tripartite-type tricarboxylate transporter receptor subunit TctC